MKLKTGFVVLVLFLALKAVILYWLYATGQFAIPWAVTFTSVWYVICGLFFWFYFEKRTRDKRFLAAQNAVKALGVVIMAQLTIGVVSILGQLWLIQYADKRLDEWAGVLAGYSELYVYGGFAANRMTNIWLQFTANYHPRLQEWSIVLAIEVLALVMVFRKMRRQSSRT